ncbi:unnamed protein product [Closterium sp. NIES-65]|nr:unnamed protein product [Closterium sp. NIES-65]
MRTAKLLCYKGLGVGDVTIIRALAKATGRKEAVVKSNRLKSVSEPVPPCCPTFLGPRGKDKIGDECGDLGLVAKASRTTQRMMMQPAPLTCHKVFEAFRFIAKESGSQSVEKKRARIKQLLVSARQQGAAAAVMHEDFREGTGVAAGDAAAAAAGAAGAGGGGAGGDDKDGAIRRLGMGLLRQLGEEGMGGRRERLRKNGRGRRVKEGKVLSKREKLARLPGRLEEAVRIMKHAYSVLPVYDQLFPSLLRDGIWGRSRGVSLQGLTFTCEYKYDGERTQVHGLADGTVQIYSRNAECTTGKFPDLVQAVITSQNPSSPPFPLSLTGMRKKVYVKTFVLDVEAVVYDRESDRVAVAHKKGPRLCWMQRAVAYDRRRDKILPFRLLSSPLFPLFLTCRHKKSHVQTFVLDAEAVAYDRESDKILPFQVCMFAFVCSTSTAQQLLTEKLVRRREVRARQRGEAPQRGEARQDRMTFESTQKSSRQQLLTEKLVRRRELLLESFEAAKGEFQFATAITTSKEEELQAFFDDAVNHSCEGAMVKTLDVDATYEPAKRSNNWLKLKKDYMEGCGGDGSCVWWCGGDGSCVWWCGGDGSCVWWCGGDGSCVWWCGGKDYVEGWGLARLCVTLSLSLLFSPSLRSHPHSDPLPRSVLTLTLTLLPRSVLTLTLHPSVLTLTLLPHSVFTLALLPHSVHSVLSAPSLSSLCSLCSLTLFTLFSLLPHSVHSVLSGPSLSSLCSLCSLTLFTLFSLLPHSLHSFLSAPSLSSLCSLVSLTLVTLFSRRPHSRHSVLSSPSLSSLCSLVALTLVTLFSRLPHSRHSVLSSPSLSSLCSLCSLNLFTLFSLLPNSLPIRLGDSLDLVLIGAFHEVPHDPPLPSLPLGDSLDLVPIGAFHGRGKRTGVFGAFLLACYDPDTEEYQSICKIGTGFSEAALEERSASLRKRVIDKPPVSAVVGGAVWALLSYGETLGVEVWFEPSEVWEVRAADLSISPVHRAATGHVNETKGIALRFPRFLRLRDDKSAEQATSSEQVSLGMGG